MASTCSFGLCTALLTTLLIEGVRGQCGGETAKLLPASELWTTMHFPGIKLPYKVETRCQWRILAAEDYFVQLRVHVSRRPPTHDFHGCVSVFDGDAPKPAALLGSCVASEQDFFTTGRNVYILYVSTQRVPMVNFTLQYRAFTTYKFPDSSPAETDVTMIVGFVLGFPVGLGMLVFVVILCRGYLCCSAQSIGPASPPSQANHDNGIIPTGSNRASPLDDIAPLLSQANHDSARDGVISTSWLEADPSPANTDCQSPGQTAAGGNRAQ